MTQLTVGKWIFIWMCLGELIALAVALGLYLSGKVEGVYAKMTPDEQHNQHTAELTSIKTGMGHSGQGSTGNRCAAALLCRLPWQTGRTACMHAKASAVLVADSINAMALAQPCIELSQCSRCCSQRGSQ